MNSYYDDPEFIAWAQRVRTELVPKIEDSKVFVSVTPLNKKEVDVKFAVELGLAVMLNKPIIALIEPNTEIPEKLARVVDRWVEYDRSDPKSMEKVVEVLSEIIKEDGLGKE